MQEESISHLQNNLSQINQQIEIIEQDIQRKIEEKSSLLNQKNFIEQEIEKFKHDSLPTHITKMHDILTNFFQLSSFYPWQEEAILNLLNNRDCFCIQPTGGGKSLVYQVASLLMNGIALVISPLISLSHNQISILNKAHIPAVMISSQMHYTQINQIYQQMLDRNNSLKFLFVTPEKVVKSQLLLKNLDTLYRQNRFSMFVIDEVHCCSIWGHDFRQDYLQLGLLKDRYPSVPMVALSATCTIKVQRDIFSILHLKQSNLSIYTGSFYRDNIYIQILEKPSVFEQQINLIYNWINNNYPYQTGIIYCLSIHDTEEVTSALKQKGLTVEAYHSNLNENTRHSIYNQWNNENINIIVATVAFGLGVHKSNVRYVIHHSCSPSISHYYQEMGRCGRDHLPANSLILYSFNDVIRLSSMNPSRLEDLYNMVHFCENLLFCHHFILIQYFNPTTTKIDNNDNIEIKQCIDHCHNCQRDLSTIINQHDVTSFCKNIISYLSTQNKNQQKVTHHMLCQYFTKQSKDPLYNHLNIKRIISTLILSRYIDQYFYQHQHVLQSYLQCGPESSKLSSSSSSSILVDLYTQTSPKLHSNKKLKMKRKTKD